MTELTMDITGLDRLIAKSEGAPEILRSAVGRGLLTLASRVVETAQSLIGIPYPPASVPGEPPHLRTGALRRSARIEESESDPEAGYVVVAVGGPGTGVPYAAALEFGTSRIEPRPFLQPTISALFPEAEAIFLEAAEKALSEAFEA